MSYPRVHTGSLQPDELKTIKGNPSKFHIFFQVSVEVTRSVRIALDSPSEVLQMGERGLCSDRR